MKAIYRSELDFSSDLLEKTSLPSLLLPSQTLTFPMAPSPCHSNGIPLPSINELGLNLSDRTGPSSSYDPPSPNSIANGGGNGGSYLHHQLDHDGLPFTPMNQLNLAYCPPQTTTMMMMMEGSPPHFPYHYMTLGHDKAFYMGIRRHRVTSSQKEVLNRVFKQSFFPTTEIRTKLAHELGMTPRTVQIWFQNKRQAWRTKHKTTNFHHQNSNSNPNNLSSINLEGSRTSPSQPFYSLDY